MRSRGYPLEIHTVVTEDGYVLELHRIPGSINELLTSQGEKPKQKKAVFLQHGIFATDFVWASGPSNSSLGTPTLFALGC